MVYLIQAIDGGPIKIGYTASATACRRLESIQTGHPYRLRVIAEIPGSLGLERYLHRKFATYRLEGEWFEVGPELERLCSAVRAKTPANGGLLSGLPPIIGVDA